MTEKAQILSLKGRLEFEIRFTPFEVVFTVPVAPRQRFAGNGSGGYRQGCAVNLDTHYKSGGTVHRPFATRNESVAYFNRFASLLRAFCTEDTWPSTFTWSSTKSPTTG